MNRVYLPAKEAEDWRDLLAEPDKQWKPKFSAHSLAHAWQPAASTNGNGFPQDVARVLATAPALSGMELLLALPEHQVALPGGQRPSQTDLWLLARSKSGLVSIAVEAKVDESFGPRVSEWLKDASPGKHERLGAIQKLLGLEGELPASTRYQLLHRTASAVLEAQRFGATQACMLVHSFSASDSSLSDYQSFLRLFGCSGGANQAIDAGTRSGVRLHFAWVRSPFPVTI
jgi:hypothetical protein